LKSGVFPVRPGREGYSFQRSYLTGYQDIIKGGRPLGILYLKYDLSIINERLALYGLMVILIIILSFTLAYFVSRRLQQSISKPILTLAETVKDVSDHQDYSVRAVRFGNDELGFLTDAFNQMLITIQEQNQEITSFTHDLEEKVIDRTFQLEIVNKELEAFSYSVSHDLRAPLRAVNGYAKILEEDYDGVLDNEGKRLLRVVRENAKKMGVLIDDLLAFSRLGRKELSKSLINMNNLTEAALAEINKTTNHNARIIINELHPITADPNLINQVMINLLSNAIKYSSGKEFPEVEISSETDGEYNIYSVKDNGAGFNNEYAGKLFGVFQRLHSTEEFEGTGVGLALVKRIISKHGGEVWASGEVGNGAVFYFSMPKKPESSSIHMD
jgi:signal transduction histidine kinase